jgi:RNA polymerase sigma-70 factor (ECF subfamily)
MELLERFARGELEAFETLFRQFQGEVYRSIIRIVRDPGIAEDLTVETFWRVYQARFRFDPTRSFGAWAHRIGTNAAIDHLKTVRHVELWTDKQNQGAPPNPAVQREIRERVERAIVQLPVKLQVVTRLALIEELTYQEIADALGISVGAVKSRVFRAVRTLRNKLKRMGIEP